jgi:transcriptional regulator with XRE-family HTH domain
MSKRKPMDKTQARERRNRLLESAAAAELSLTEGVREMRAIAGMTQDEFAAHRGVSARVIKALELGQGNPTVATLNRIGEFFGLEVAFVPIQRKPNAKQQPELATALTELQALPFNPDLVLKHEDVAHAVILKEVQLKSPTEIIRNIEEAREDIWRRISTAIEALQEVYLPSPHEPAPDKTSAISPAGIRAPRKKRSPPS